MKLSAVIVGRDNEWCIERALRSLMFFDEIIFGDTGSIDNTPKIAEKLGAKVFDIKKEPYDMVWAKSEVARLASNDHVFLLDTDEFIHPGIYNWLMDKFTMYPNTKVLFPQFEQHSPYMYIKMFYPSYRCRARNKTITHLEKLPHEDVIGGYPEVISPFHIFHRGWVDIERDVIHWRYFEHLGGHPIPSLEESEKLILAGYEQMATSYTGLPKEGLEEMRKYEEVTRVSSIIIPPPLKSDELLWQRI